MEKENRARGGGVWGEHRCGGSTQAGTTFKEERQPLCVFLNLILFLSF